MYRGNQRCWLVGYVMHQMTRLIDGSQGAVWPLALEDEIPQNYENRSNTTCLHTKSKLQINNSDFSMF